MNYRANCLKLADYLEQNVPNNLYSHPQPYRMNMGDGCGSACCAYGWARFSNLFGLSETRDGINKFEADDIFGPGSFERIFRNGAFPSWTPQVTEVIARLREFAYKFPAEPLKELKLGSDIAREIMSRPFNEKESAHV